MKVKFCGMTNIEDVKSAVDLGVDFVGFVFYEKSKRFISYDEARDIIGKIGKSIKSVGVFVNQKKDEIEQAINYCNLDYAQVYQDISNVNTIRVYRIDRSLPENIESGGFILFDSYTKSIGGSGISFDLNLLEDFRYKDRLIVAGGVSIDNIEKIAGFNVFGVDLVSSIEQIPGKKSYEKMREFMEAVKSL